jgi:hypothetical protein
MTHLSIVGGLGTLTRRTPMIGTIYTRCTVCLQLAYDPRTEVCSEEHE